MNQRQYTLRPDIAVALLSVVYKLLALSNSCKRLVFICAQPKHGQAVCWLTVKFNRQLFLRVELFEAHPVDNPGPLRNPKFSHNPHPVLTVAGP